MKEIGTGVDIEQISRFSGLSRVHNGKFLNRIFTGREQEYCFTHETPDSHLAVRYAGKEAVIKALTELKMAKGIYYRDIEILNNKDRVPVASILKEGCSDLKINISFSHTSDLAVAFCLISRVRKRRTSK
jgi:holo-[acyl-carrier protein] synthase